MFSKTPVRGPKSDDSRGILSFENLEFILEPLQSHYVAVRSGLVDWNRETWNRDALVCVIVEIEFLRDH